jgi:hypothetical protein
MYESTTIVKPTRQTNLYISVTIHQIPRIKDNSSFTSITQTKFLMMGTTTVNHTPKSKEKKKRKKKYTKVKNAHTYT